MSGLLIASKSSWTPSIRREHALAALASQHGYPVTFIEAADDIRALRLLPAAEWAGGLFRPRACAVRPGIERVARSTLLPAHRSRLSEALDTRLLHRVMGHEIVPDTATVAVTFPWNWPAAKRMRGVRRVFDLGDDWGVLIPRAARRVSELYKRAAQEADAISVVSDELRAVFGGREVTVVRNAVSGEVLGAPLRPAPGHNRMVYVGTLSERFDATLAGRLLDLLPGWTLDLFGQCAYARMEHRPAPELGRLLDRGDGRARWHGPVPREELVSVLDGADVLLLLNREEHARGQDSMKLYDYAARGRPIVANDGATRGISERPPHLRSGSDADALAALVADSVGEPADWAAERAAWAAEQSWDSRWPSWSKVMFGVGAAGPQAGSGTPQKQAVMA